MEVEETKREAEESMNKKMKDFSPIEWVIN